MHWIEKHVLRELITNPKLRYGQIKPKNIEGSLFLYHLRSLHKADLVQKTNDKCYELTPKGRLYADKLQIESLNVYEQPRIVVLIACWDDKKGLLLFKRSSQPVIHMTGFPHVNIHMGSQLVTGAQQEFEAISGLSLELKRRGDGYITMYRGSEPESYIFFHLLEGKNPSGTLNESIETGSFEWQKTIDYTDEAIMPSMKELVGLLQSSEDIFFFEQEYKLPDA